MALRCFLGTFPVLTYNTDYVFKEQKNISNVNAFVEKFIRFRLIFMDITSIRTQN